MAKGVEIDFETRSPVDLKTHGAYVYFEHPEARVLLGSYKTDGGPVRRWRLGDPPPEDLETAIINGATISAHNAGFEMLCFQWLADNAGWTMPNWEQFRCTAATAAAMSLPRDLKTLGEVLNLDVQKDREGVRLMRMFSIPAKDGSFKSAEDYPEDFEAYHRYCDIDVITEEEADKKLVPLSADEQDVWQLSERINRRGIRIDVKSAQAAIRMAELAVADLNREMAELTGGAVRKVSEVSKLVAWIKEQGVDVDKLAKNDLEELLGRTSLPEDVRKALELRQEGAKTSVKKLEAMLARASADGRVRGSFMYHGAGTGRWTSMGVNFANMPRPRRIFEDSKVRTDVLFKAFRTGDPNVLRELYGDELGRPLHLISDAVRGFVWAAPGHDLVQADYSGIEGAVIAWLADEEWKLAAMHDIIADPKIPDMYRQTAARIMNLPLETVDKKHWARQAVGKVSELACFGPETQVLTSNGVKAIKEVTYNDLLWDGVEWVKHQGVISKGVRRVVTVDGIDLTPDHLVRTGETWTQARLLGSKRSLLAQALATGSASLKSWGCAQGLQGGLPQLLSAAAAGPSLTKSLFRPCDAALQLGVTPAPRKLRGKLATSCIMVTTTSYRTRNIADAFLTAYRPATTVASTLKLKGSKITEAAASPSNGGGTGELFSRILSRLKAGISRILNLTASMSMETTDPEICVSYLAAPTLRTNDPCQSFLHALESLNELSLPFKEVFDIVEAGPRNRFTVLSDSGALVVHNCGFQGGVSAFASMAAIYGVDLDALYGPTWDNASEEEREKAEKRHNAVSKRAKEATDRMSREAWLACEIIKRGWRQQNSAIAGTWQDAEGAVREAVREPGKVTSAIKCRFVVRAGFLWMQLPSGRCLAYASPRLTAQVWAKVRLDTGEWSDPEVMDREDAERGAERGTVKIEGDTSPRVSFCGVDGVTKRWTRGPLYGGLIVQNATQAVARDLLVNGMRKAEAAGYPVIAHVYDEMICEVPRGFGDLKFFEKLICELPPWAEGLPLTAGGWIGKRYRKD